MSRDLPRSQEESLDSIANALWELLRLYRAHVRLTAKTAKLSVEPLRQAGHPVVDEILEILQELEDVSS